MRYIGGKSLVLSHINNIITNHTEQVNTVLDIFAGSGVVSNNFKNNKYRVISNDFMYFSYVLNRGSVCINKQPQFDTLKKYIFNHNPISYLNNLTIDKTIFTINDCFIYKNYSPNNEYNCDRMYFQNKNAIKIDIIRLTIEQWKNNQWIDEDEYFYLLASLLHAVPYVANIAGIYAAYLKFWDNRTYNDLTLKDINIIENNIKHTAYNMNAEDIADKVSVDLVYLDPPYNSRQYLPNYHILETIAKYDYPVIHGVSGMRIYNNQKSVFSQKSKVKEAFKNLFSILKTRYFLLSYNNEGLLSTNEIKDIINSSCNIKYLKLFEYNYRRYKNKIPNNNIGLKEQLFFCEKSGS